MLDSEEDQKEAVLSAVRGGAENASEVAETSGLSLSQVLWLGRQLVDEGRLQGAKGSPTRPWSLVRKDAQPLCAEPAPSAAPLVPPAASLVPPTAPPAPPAQETVARDSELLRTVVALRACGGDHLVRAIAHYRMGPPERLAMLARALEVRRLLQDGPAPMAPADRPGAVARQDSAPSVRGSVRHTVVLVGGNGGQEAIYRKMVEEAGYSLTYKENGSLEARPLAVAAVLIFLQVGHSLRDQVLDIAARAGAPVHYLRTILNLKDALRSLKSQKAA